MWITVVQLLIIKGGLQVEAMLIDGCSTLILKQLEGYGNYDNDD